MPAKPSDHGENQPWRHSWCHPSKRSNREQLDFRDTNFTTQITRLIIHAFRGNVYIYAVYHCDEGKTSQLNPQPTGRKNLTMKTSILLVSILSLSLPLAIADNALPVTKEKQDALTPDAVLTDLSAGNKRFVEGKLSEPKVKARVKASTTGQ
ncbi:MAG: hypothetical protein ACI8XO_001965 [Verrucomicrobiales bacterium]